jgi:hypothetical protein
MFFSEPLKRQYGRKQVKGRTGLLYSTPVRGSVIRPMTCLLPY